MQEAFRRLASGHIMRMVAESKSVDMRNLDGLVARVVNELSVVVITQWPTGSCGVSVQTVVVQELERLVRRGRLAMSMNKFRNLTLEPREEVLRPVSPIR